MIGLRVYCGHGEEVHSCRAPFRPVAPDGAQFALLVSLTAAGTAVAHAMEHAQVVQEHRDGHGPSMVPELEAADHGHEHGHASVDTPQTPRDSHQSSVMIATVRRTAVDLTPSTAAAPHLQQLPRLLFLPASFSRFLPLPPGACPRSSDDAAR